MFFRRPRGHFIRYGTRALLYKIKNRLLYHFYHMYFAERELMVNIGEDRLDYAMTSIYYRDRRRRYIFDIEPNNMVMSISLDPRPLLSYLRFATELPFFYLISKQFYGPSPLLKIYNI